MPQGQAESNAACIERLEIPLYPPLAAQARIEGTITLSVLLTSGGKVEQVDTEIASKYSQARNLFATPVWKVIKEAKFRPNCAGKTVRLVFHFDLEGVSPGNLRASTSFGFPNTFWIVAEALHFQPGNSDAAVSGRNNHRPITAKEAQELIHAMLKADDWTKLRRFHIESPHTIVEFPRFYEIYAEYYNPGGSGQIGDYAVEKTTAEVWYWNICARLTSPALLKAQEGLREEIGLSDADYRALQRPGPSCEPGETPSVKQTGRPMRGLQESDGKGR